jgi:hypothetical protein
MPGSSRQHRGEKRRKELARKDWQQEKRQRRAEKKPGGVGGGPPIDWEAAASQTSPSGNPTSEAKASDPEEVKPS